MIRFDVIWRRWYGSWTCAPGWTTRNRVLCHSPDPVYRVMDLYHRRNPVYLWWYLRAAGWLVAGVQLALVDPRLVPAGIVTFEVVVYVLGRRSYRPEDEWGAEPPPQWDAGDREPRTPYPAAGSGSVGLPLPPADG